jgi:hypothetical protein
VSILRRLMGPSPAEMVADVVMREEPEPLEGTRMDLFNSIIPNFFNEMGVGTTPYYPTKDLGSKVWIANRCQKLNSQAIASMPLEWHGPDGVDEPMWISAPDPALFPNGIGDALHTIVDQMYGWGFSCQFVTEFYANGYPRNWTVLPSSLLFIDFDEDGRRRYRWNGSSDPLDASRIVQIDRNPSTAAHGTPALSAHAQLAWGLLAAGNQSMTMSQGGIPSALLKPQKKITKEQADNLAARWDAATAARAGVRVLPPDLEFEVLSINPAELQLLESQQWNAMMLAAAYGIPGPIVNMALTGGLTYQNPVALMQMWWLTELSTTSKRIMDAFSHQMLPRGQWVAQDATDMTLEGSLESEDDPQASEPSSGASASPAQQDNVVPIRSARDEAKDFADYVVSLNRNGNGNGHQPAVTFSEGAIQVEAPPMPHVTVEPASITVQPANVHVDVERGVAMTRTLEFSDGRTATLTEEPNVDQ